MLSRVDREVGGHLLFVFVLNLSTFCSRLLYQPRSFKLIFSRSTSFYSMRRSLCDRFQVLLCPSSRLNLYLQRWLLDVHGDAVCLCKKVGWRESWERGFSRQRAVLCDSFLLLGKNMKHICYVTFMQAAAASIALSCLAFRIAL